MRVYCVGGAVRDELLGLPVADRDWVVVGATPEDMVAAGYTPVGRDFPVFLHPDTHEEYALARTERKSGRGYRGFTVYAAPEVTLEEDLARRDLTINAMARGADGVLVDPFGGAADLAAGVLRHVGPAFEEDPVRILRVARFAARFGFEIAPETGELMASMVSSGEVDHLVPERVWQELSRGLVEDRPSRMFQVLRDCGALARLLPELDRLWGVPQRPEYHPEVDTGVHVMMVLDCAAAAGEPLAVRWAALMHDLGKGATPTADLPRHPGHEERGVTLAKQVAERLRVPADCRDLAQLVARHHGEIHRAEELRAGTLVTLLERLDAFRRPERVELVLAACRADYRGREGYAGRPYPQADILRRALEAARAVDAGAVAGACADQAAIPGRIHQERVRAVAARVPDSGPA